VRRTVLIVDDHDGFRASARLLLESEGWAVVGEAADAASGLRAARALRPALVVVDVGLPDGDGFEVARALAHGPDAPQVVVVSSREGAELVALALRSGARGFLSKGDLSGAALEALIT
jgi:DNA-binding NarL/FixJ family response regulator